MVRLPIPQADEGDWGDILNEFILTTHDATGGLKANSVNSIQLAASAVTNPKIADNSISTAKLQNSAVTTMKLADGAVTASKLASDATRADGLRSVHIFYAPPANVNSRFDNDYAAGILARYDDVVLGTGLQDPSSPDYANTTAVIQKLAALNPDTVVWGYIDCGVSTGNIPINTLKTHIDQWIAIGATGIFCDVIGYAYLVPRSRQNEIIDYIHSKGVGAILNVFNPDEVLSSAVDATYNPSGTPTTANSSDVLLLESWVCNSDAYASPFYATFSDIKTRGDKARSYRDSIGLRIFSVNIFVHTGQSDSTIDSYRSVCEAMARVFRLDGDCFAVSNYAATGTDIVVARPRFPLFRANPLRPDAPYILNGSWTQIEAPDLGITIAYDVGTHTAEQL